MPQLNIQLTRNKIRQDEMYCGYSTESDIRRVAASGGIVTAILVHLLDSGRVDGAIVTRIASTETGIGSVTELVRTREEIIQAAGSSYIFSPVLKQIKMLEEHDSRVAVVALPCQVRSIRKLIERRPQLQQKVAAIIGLFCRGAVTPQFYEDFLRKEGLDQHGVEHVRVSRSHIKGQMSFQFRSGRTATFPFFKVNAYRTAGFHAHTACLRCIEHFADEADISVGDIFTRKFKKRDIRHSAFICRTPLGVEMLGELKEKGAIKCEYFGLENYLQTFRKLEKYSNSLPPRDVAARLVRWKFAHGTIRPCNPFHVLAWAFYILNYRLSRTERGRRFVYALPSPLIKLMAIVIKVLARISL